MEYEYDEMGIRYREMINVYPVREDSILLMDTVLRSFHDEKGSVMEMGCGTALLSLALASGEWNVVAVDRESKALLNLRHNLNINDLNADLYLSDIFQGIPSRLKGYFDLICFNPPYLQGAPGEIDRRDDLALLGGRSGFEITLRFLKGAADFLHEGGCIMLLVPEAWPSNWDSMTRSIFSDRSNVRTNDIDGEVFSIMKYIL